MPGTGRSAGLPRAGARHRLPTRSGVLRGRKRPRDGGCSGVPARGGPRRPGPSRQRDLPSPRPSPDRPAWPPVTRRRALMSCGRPDGLLRQGLSRHFGAIRDDVELELGATRRASLDQNGSGREPLLVYRVRCLVREVHLGNPVEAVPLRNGGRAAGGLSHRPEDFVEHDAVEVRVREQVRSVDVEEPLLVFLWGHAILDFVSQDRLEHGRGSLSWWSEREVSGPGPEPTEPNLGGADENADQIWAPLLGGPQRRFGVTESSLLA